MLDVKRIRVFREVAARGSFSAAAEALSFTQSAVSQQVAALEREAGTQLLDRTPRGVRLTDSGRALMAHADAILARLESAEDELAELAGLRGGRLRLASFQSAGATLVPRAVAAFHARHPNVELSMVEAEPGEAQTLLREGDIDLALVYDYAAVPGLLTDDLELEHLLDDAYEAVLPVGHKLAASDRVALTDLADDPWIGPTERSGCRPIIDHALRQVGSGTKIAFETDETMSAQAFVAAQIGITLYPKLGLSPLHPGVVARPLAEPVLRRIYTARMVAGFRSPACEAMQQLLVDAAAQFREGDPPLTLASSA